MHKPSLGLLVLLFFFPLASPAQDCKAHFSVAHSDGKTIQPGLTAEQSKFWQQNGEKKYKGMCLDEEKPQYLILWTEDLVNGQISQAITDDLNRVRRAPSSTGIRNQGTEKASVNAIPSASIHETAYFFVFDLSQDPAAMLYKGKGETARPLVATQSSRNSRGSTVVKGNEQVNASDFSRTIADPVEAMKNALEWLKKKK
jgi:hypothetical protein